MLRCPLLSVSLLLLSAVATSPARAGHSGGGDDAQLAPKTGSWWRQLLGAEQLPAALRQRPRRLRQPPQFKPWGGKRSTAAALAGRRGADALSSAAADDLAPPETEEALDALLERAIADAVEVLDAEARHLASTLADEASRTQHSRAVERARTGLRSWLQKRGENFKPWGGKRAPELVWNSA